MFIPQFEVENGALREANKQREAQVEELKQQLLGNDPPAFEQKGGGGGGGVPRSPGEARRLSSLTFGCFQVKAKSPQVLTGPEPSQRTLSSQESEGQNGKASFAPRAYLQYVLSPVGGAHLFAGRRRLSGSSGTDAEAQTPEPTPEDGGVPETPAEESRGPGPEGVGGAGGRKSGHGGEGPESRRASSDTCVTASDDSSSLFDLDVQPGFAPRRPSAGGPGGRRQDAGGGGAKLEDSEELRQRFQSQNLDSSSSSSEPNTPSPILTPALTPKRPNPPQDLRDNPASPKQPRLRPAGAGLAKKHLSQPPISSEAARGQTRNALSMLRPFTPPETDADREPEVVMETCSDAPRALPITQAALPLPSPPTPPLHRLPSWVRFANWE